MNIIDFKLSKIKLILAIIFSNRFFGELEAVFKHTLLSAKEQASTNKQDNSNHLPIPRAIINFIFDDLFNFIQKR
jgi:hypothetical protein